MTSIFGLSIGSLKEYHIKYLQKLYSKKEKTLSRVKELQSAIIFFSTFTESEEIGLQWRKTHAKNVNISIIIGALKHFGKVLNLPLHRVCKTAYPVNVYISHYYDELKPYLDTLQFVDVPKNMELPVIDDPFNNAENYIKTNGISSNTVQYASLVLASSISKQENIKIEHVAFYTKQSDEPAFIAFKKEQGKFFPIVNNKSEEISAISSVDSSSYPQSPISSPQEPIRRLPNIFSMVRDAGFSEDIFGMQNSFSIQGLLNPISVF